MFTFCFVLFFFFFFCFVCFNWIWLLDKKYREIAKWDVYAWKQVNRFLKSFRYSLNDRQQRRKPLMLHFDSFWFICRIIIRSKFLQPLIFYLECIPRINEFLCSCVIVVRARPQFSLVQMRTKCLYCETWPQSIRLDNIKKEKKKKRIYICI